MYSWKAQQGSWHLCGHLGAGSTSCPMPWHLSAGSDTCPAQKSLQELQACLYGATLSLVSWLGCLLQHFAWATQHQEGTVMCLLLSLATTRLAIKNEGRQGTWESCCCFTYVLCDPQNAYPGTCATPAPPGISIHWFYRAHLQKFPCTYLTLGKDNLRSPGQDRVPGQGSDIGHWERDGERGRIWPPPTSPYPAT